MLKVNIRKKLNKYTLDVDFETDNEVMGLLGMSGSGKSMTLKCIAGIVRPDEGEIILNDRILFDSKKKINLTPQERKIGFLFQDYALFPNMTVGENVLTGIEETENSGAEVDRILNELNLLSKKNLYPRQISGGEKQRTALARIFVTKPEIMLLDEPFAALDEFNRWKMEFELNKALNKYVKSAILVSHNKDEVYRLTSNVCVLHEGKGERKRPTMDLFENPKTYASSILSGLKNFSKYERLADDRIYAQAWWTELLIYGVVPSPNGLISVSLTKLGLYKNLPDSQLENVIVTKIVDILYSVDYCTVVLKINESPEAKDFVLDIDKNELEGLKAGDVAYLHIPRDSIKFLESDYYDENGL